MLLTPNHDRLINVRSGDEGGRGILSHTANSTTKYYLKEAFFFLKKFLARHYIQRKIRRSEQSPYMQKVSV